MPNARARSDTLRVVNERVSAKALQSAISRLSVRLQLFSFFPLAHPPHLQPA